ncbi:MAG: rhamnogalacturonan acetylesterase [Prevotella sp.]|nr:rhamnogalacturonan acetylesterase [Prevotella sp.]
MKKTILTILFSCALAVTTHAEAKTYDFNKSVGVYSSANDAGWDFSDAADQGARLTGRSKALPSSPIYFSVNVPDGNYRVTLVLGSKKRAAETWVRAESRRLMLQGEKTKKGELRTVSFVVNKRNTVIDNKRKVLIKPGEVGSLTWDDKLTLEFCGAAPAVQSVTIEPDTTAVTLFLCGNSTVVDQGREPWASWGQMFPRWFTDKVCVANYGESGLTATSFLAQLRLDKILSEIKKGDYVFCEFGHNDEKEKGPGRGAWYHYSMALKTFVDRVRDKGGNIIFCTPTQRRFFEKDGTVRNTHGDFPAAMKAVAEREQVPVIDLNATTKTLFEAMGEDGCRNLLVHYPAGSFPWQEKAFADNTHFNPFGAYELSKLIVMGLKQMGSPLVSYLKADWQDFSPSQPDVRTDDGVFPSPAVGKFFPWPESIFNDNRKPDGN